MVSVLDRIHSYRPSLTPGAEKVAAFCARDPELVSRHTIHEVARRTGVSVATVSRLAATLGYGDWKEMRLALARASANVNEQEIFPDILSGDSDAAIARKIFEGDILSLRATLDQLDTRLLGRAVRALVKTGRVVFFGSGGSGCIARDESLRFAHLEMAAEAYTEEFAMMLQASRMRRGEVAVGFSNSGRSRATVDALREAKRNKAFAIAIANHRGTPLEEAADIFFLTAFSRRGGVTASLTARIAVQGIMDAMYVLVSHHGRMTASVERLDAVLERHLRLPPRERQRPARKGPTTQGGLP